MPLLREELDELAATGVQRQKFETDVPKALAAIAKAREVGARAPLSYAMSVFNSPTAPGPKAKDSANRSVVVSCTHCDGDRFVFWEQQPDPYDDSYAKCPYCNPDANTVRHGFASPSNDRVRERLARA